MKKVLSSILLLLPITMLLGQAVNDTTLIKQLLSKEGIAWRTADVEAFKSCWQQRPYNTVLVSTTNGRVLDLNPNFILNASAASMGGGGFSVHTNFVFSIHDNSAWVKHDEVSISKTGERAFTKEIRFLEKVNGQWKLVGQTGLGYVPVKENNTSDTTSYIQTVNIETGEINTLASMNGHYEAPNWHPDNYLILNTYGKLIKFDVATKQTSFINTGKAINCNNDHGISPDKKSLVISNFDTLDLVNKIYKSNIYTLPIEGGTPKLITKFFPSYWHGWSPDGKTLAYCAERKGNYDIYTIPAGGGNEKRLTTTDGLDDGPDYSADGKYIYFNSYRTGHMQIWRMQSDGSNQEQLTFDENSNWFAHPSPDNQWIVYISYLSDEKHYHLFGKQVQLKLMNIATKQIKDITPVFFGGQGTINVPSWSADSKKVAFVSYSIK